MNETFFRVIGYRPVSWAQGQRTSDWRKFIKKKCSSYFRNSLNVNNPEKLSVKIIFYFRNNGPDLDNLAKPVLDTLFKVNNPQTEINLTGVLFNFDDNKVVKLVLQKRKVKAVTEEGVDIHIKWNLNI